MQHILYTVYPTRIYAVGTYAVKRFTQRLNGMLSDSLKSEHHP